MATKRKHNPKYSRGLADRCVMIVHISREERERIYAAAKVDQRSASSWARHRLLSAVSPVASGLSDTYPAGPSIPVGEVHYRCGICGASLVIDLDEGAEAIRTVAHAFGDVHRLCVLAA